MKCHCDEPAVVFIEGRYYCALCHRPHRPRLWPMALLSIACIALAAGVVKYCAPEQKPMPDRGAIMKAKLDYLNARFDK